MIDLHSHSTASDGTLAPAELVDQAEAVGLRALALTDHDTLAGLPAFLDAGRQSPVETVAGVEVACRYEKQNLHLVGLFVDHRCRRLQDLLEHIRDARDQRNADMLGRLAEHGMDISAADLEPWCRGQVMGRPHMARVLVEQGHCRTVKEAFERFLGRGRPAYVQRQLPTPDEAIRALHAAGGVAVWAHPLAYGRLTNARLDRILTDLRAFGLDGMETYYSEYTANHTARALAAAAARGLLRAGGSDFHGTTIPGVSLGVGRGHLSVPDDCLEPLRQRAVRRRAQHTHATGRTLHAYE